MADYLSKRGANIAPSYAAIADLPASTEVGDLVFVGGQLGIAVDASTFNTCDKTDISTGFNWASATQQAKMQASDVAGALLGGAIAIDTDTLVVGARKLNSNTGAAYVFTRSGTSWSQQAKLTASDAAAYNEFGNATAIEGDTIVIGSHQSDNGGFYVDYTGSAYIYTRSGTSWTQVKKIQSSDIQAGDNFGKSVAIYSNTIVAGAWGEDTGANLAGAAYAFTA